MARVWTQRPVNLRQRLSPLELPGVVPLLPVLAHGMAADAALVLLTNKDEFRSTFNERRDIVIGLHVLFPFSDIVASLG